MASLSFKALPAMLLPLTVACTSTSATAPTHSVTSQMPADRSSDNGAPRTSLTECMQAEDTIFSGEVDDGFGMSITICAAKGSVADGATITVLYSGEGGGRAVSCTASTCDGVISFTHYSRFRFTELTVQWRDENGIQRLVETFNAEAGDIPAHHSLRHAWVRSSDEADFATTDSYSVTSGSDQLSLMELGMYLPSNK